MEMHRKLKVLFQEKYKHPEFAEPAKQEIIT